MKEYWDRLQLEVSGIGMMRRSLSVQKDPVKLLKYCLLVKGPSDSETHISNPSTGYLILDNFTEW